jgi:hypothetical protein
MQSGNDGAAATKRGEWVEAKFLARAQEAGLNVSRPWGGSSRYDFAIEQGGRFRRVQVKSTMNRNHDGYVCTLKTYGGRGYTPEEVDFFAIYVVPEELWYIIPATVAGEHRRNFFLAPARKNSKYERFREAWGLLTEAEEERESTVQAEVAEDPEAKPGWIESLSGRCEEEDPRGAAIRRAFRTFEFLRRQMGM